ncbi:polysaccharide deacetylase family protein [Virgibacillus sp. NKC19-16]|uniref:polysaccharide deacetylase family protein n=1 Tax=Virgibacillus salidurans TaxID=2831673 RepID=UPI001F2E1EFB|nr:polysaccharide deacetylase family protein [Virgibacillus sp. NKC19-16]UJL45818.1 polysaccharide deacetylase family protein [Virgibacillus sp. NKC19-16]
MKNAYLTIDVEEWYDLDYLKKFDLNEEVEVIPEIIDFLDLLDELQVKATFFVLANVLDKNADIIKDIVRRGHAVGCHGYDHELLYNKNIEEFGNEIAKAKEKIEEVTNQEVNGYRAACFSMERDKLDVTYESDYKYDSSYIKFEEHPLYRNLDLTGFEKIDDLVYRKNNLFEYEIPTLKIGGYSLPISGGGYLRLFPFWMLRILIKMYEKQQKNFLLYLHPFELTDLKLPFTKEIGWKDRFRASVGRKSNKKKITKVIKLLKSMGAEFRTLDQDVLERVKN